MLLLLSLGFYLNPITSHLLVQVLCSLLIFWVDLPPIADIRALKSPTIIVLQSVSPFSFVSVCSVHLGALRLGACIFLFYLPGELPCCHYIISFFGVMFETF